MSGSTKNTTYWTIFYGACDKYPDNPAVIVKDSTVCKTYLYKELFVISDKLYSKLTDLTNRCDCIGIFMRHDAYLPALLSAIHRYDCCFVCLDLNGSNSVNMKTLNDFQVTLIFSFTSDIYFDGFTVIDMSYLFNNEIKFYLFEKQYSPESIWKGCEKAIAYCIKTSGSTSIQKNVIVSHRSIYPNIKDFAELFQVKQMDIIYFSTPLTFDPSMIELYLAAYTGAALLIFNSNLETLFTDFNISPTIWQTTPSLFMKIGSNVIKKWILCERSKLRVLALGGEPYNFTKLSDLKHIRNKTIIYNLYGITEISCWASACEVDVLKSLDDTSIGNPLSETFIKITSEDGEEALEGHGSIEIGSSSRTCLVTVGQPQTEDMNIFLKENITWQKTGDLGEKRKDGKIYFRGRKDQVIKRHGNKVNLLEIENAALSFDGIKQAACVWLPKYHDVCLMIASDCNQKDKLTHYLQQKLNSHSYPDTICIVEEIPLSSHGKIAMSKVYDLYKCHANNTKHITSDKLLINIFKENLNQSLQSIDLKEKSFLELGGNSIIAVQIVNKIENLTNINISDAFLSLMNSTHPLQESIDIILKHLLKYDFNLSTVVFGEENVSSHPANSNFKRKLSDTKQNVKKIVLPNSLNAKKQIKVKWKVNLERCIDATPVLYLDENGNEFVLVGSHSGKVGMVESSSGILSHIWIVNSRVEAPVLCIDNNIHNPMAAVGAHDGSFWCFSLLEPYKTLWKIPLEAMIKSQACYLNSHVFVATYAGVIYQIDLKCGEIISNILVENESISADLIVSGYNIFAATLRGSCVCFAVLLNLMKIKWKTKLSSPVFAKPTLIKNDTQIIFCEAKGIVHSLDSQTGNEVWNFSAAQGPVFSSCLPYTTAQGEYITFGCHDQHSYHLKLIDENNILLDTKLKHCSQIFATPCLYDSQYVICLSTKGQLEIIDTQSRRVAGELSLPGEVFSSPVASGHYVYLGCRDNYLYCLSVA